MHWLPPDQQLPADADAPSDWDRYMRPLYWLAGARWETLKYCPATERERVAVIGSTVLIPTVMSFLGMIFYTKSRFADPPWLSILGIALAWSFVIMNTDRILLATYRPFQPWWRKMMQVIFRFALAAVVSVAIAFPFCLDQYRPSIRHRNQTEFQGKLNILREKADAKRKEIKDSQQQARDDDDAARKQIEADHTAKHDALTAQLPELQKAILNPEVYADELMQDERKKATAPEFVAPASPATRAVIAQIEAQKETVAKGSTAIEEKQDLHRRLVEAIARELAGQPNEFYPEKKKAGQGPRTKDMKDRDLAVTAEIRRLELSLKVAEEALSASDKQLATARLADRNAFLDGLGGKRSAFVDEANEKERLRKERLEKTNAEITALEADHVAQIKRMDEQTASLAAEHANAVKRVEEQYGPNIARFEAKISGVLDPMEETIGLYNVIFLPAPDADETERGEQGKKWIAGVFQFLVIFGTLFVLDLIPIMAKLFSRPGPYDVLVEHPEYVANTNLRAFWSNYQQHAHEWGTGAMMDDASAYRLLESHPRERPDVEPEPRVKV